MMEQHLPTGPDGPHVDPERPADPKTAELRAEKNPLKLLGKALRPGLITGASDDDPSGIGTYAQAGSQAGGPGWRGRGPRAADPRAIERRPGGPGVPGVVGMDDMTDRHDTALMGQHTGTTSHDLGTRVGRRRSQPARRRATARVSSQRFQPKEMEVGTVDLAAKTYFTTEQARAVAKKLGIDFKALGFDLEQFRMGLGVELEHGPRDPGTDVTRDDAIVTGKIALAHLTEFPDYYTRLAVLEREAADHLKARK